MGKKSKRHQGRKKEEAPPSREEVRAEAEGREVVDAVVKEARELCPEADVFYPVSRELFDCELWGEIQTNWLEPGSALPKEKAWQLVRGVQLEALTAKEVADDYVAHKDIEAAEHLELLFTAPYQLLDKKRQYRNGPQRRHFYWSLRWIDILPGIHQTIAGSLLCAPFFLDPPEEEDEHKFRTGWNLREYENYSVDVQCIRLGAAMTVKDISLQDVTRCLIPTIGILCKHHPGNRSHVLQRTMLRLERQVRTWNDGDKSNPNEWEVSDAMHRRGGMLSHAHVTECLEREKRWLPGTQANRSWWPEVFVPEGAIECCLYRNGDGYQHKLSRMADGTEIEVPTGAKKGVPSARDFMSALTTKAVFHNLSPEEVREGMRQMQVSEED